MANPVQVKGRSAEEIKAYEEKKRKEEADKKSKKILTVQKKYFDIKLSALVPCTISYRIYATDEQDALNQIKNKPPSSRNDIIPNVSQKRDIKALVYNAGSSILKLSKIFKV
jgi:hypothetical protein